MNRMTTTVFGLALIVLLCGAASATTIYVPTDHTTIQWAVDNATAGDTIYVWNGTYNENVNIGTSYLTLEGEGADVVTATAAAADDHVFYVTADYVNITGFNVTGATGGGVAGVCLWGADHCNISDNIASDNHHGIRLGSSSDNTLTGNDCSDNTGDGIALWSSSDNTLTGNDCSDNTGDGIALWSLSTNNTLTGNDCSGNGHYGISLFDSSNNTLTGNDCSGNDWYGIYMEESSDNTLTGNNCSGNDRGIMLWVSSDNTLTGNNCSGNGVWGFYSDEFSQNDVVDDLTVASYPTTISFTYENGIAIKGVDTAPSDPTGKTNIGKYVYATNVTSDSKLFLNVSYDNSDIAGLDESSLRMLQHDGTAWSAVAGSGVNVAENYVYATITEFSVFAPMGNSGAPPVYYPFGISKTDDAEDCVNSGDLLTYTICYDNLANPTQGVTNVGITDTLPVGVTFVLASGSYDHNAATRTVIWTIGNLAEGAPEACVTMNVTVDAGTEGQTLTNCATIDSDETDPAEACVTTDVCGVTPEPVPTLTPPGVALMIGLLAVVGSVMLRRRE